MFSKRFLWAFSFQSVCNCLLYNSVLNAYRWAMSLHKEHDVEQRGYILNSKNGSVAELTVFNSPKHRGIFLLRLFWRKCYNFRSIKFGKISMYFSVWNRTILLLSRNILYIFQPPLFAEKILHIAAYLFELYYEIIVLPVVIWEQEWLSIWTKVIALCYIKLYYSIKCYSGSLMHLIQQT